MNSKYAGVCAPMALRFVLLAALVPALTSRAAELDRQWTGNFAKNPGFEEDWVNENGEGHVLSFKDPDGIAP